MLDELGDGGGTRTVAICLEPCDLALLLRQLAGALQRRNFGVLRRARCGVGRVAEFDGAVAGGASEEARGGGVADSVSDIE